MQAKEIMTDNCQAIRADHSMREAARMMSQMDVGMLPVIDNEGLLIGTVTDRDLVIRGMADGQTRDDPVEQVMTREPVTCHTDDDMESIITLMEDKQLRRMLVTDGEQHVVGVVSLADLARHSPTRPMTSEVLTEVSRPQ